MQLRLEMSGELSGRKSATRPLGEPPESSLVHAVRKLGSEE